MPTSRSIFKFTPRSTTFALPTSRSYPQLFQKDRLSKIATRLNYSPKMEKTPTQRCKQVCCSIVPPNLLVDILRHDGHSEPTRAAVNNTLKSLYRRREDYIERQALAHHTRLTEDVPASEPEPEPTPDPESTPEPVTKLVQREIYDSNKTNKQRKTLIFKEGADTAAFKKDINAKEVHEYFGNSFDFYAEVFGRNSIDDAGLPLIASIHFDDIPGPPGMDNAFWDGDEMAFGDGDGAIFGSFTKNIDVIGHELTHGVIQHTADLDYEFQSGALNESLADVFGSMIKQYYHPDGKQLANDADWLIGEGIFLPTLTNAQALRSMKAPGTAYNNPKIGKDRQPADMDGYKKLPNTSSGDWGGVHTNSGIPNRAFYLAATDLGGYSWEKAGQVWYAALNDPSLRGINTKLAFNIFADLTVKYALSMFDQKVADVIKNAWVKVKVYRAASSAMDDVIIPRPRL